MSDQSSSLVNQNYFLRAGFIIVPSKSTDISTVLGSCVSVCLYDKKRKAGGMNHFKLPFIDNKLKATPLYGNVATLALIHMLLNDGSKVKHLEAQIFGGAYNPKSSTHDVGRENIKIARNILDKKRIRVVSEDVGGEKGRKVVFNSNNGEVAVLKVERLRESDWYPYASER